MKRVALKRSGPIERRTRIITRRDAPRRVSVVRDDGYLEYLRTEPLKCVACQLMRKHGQSVSLIIRDKTFFVALSRVIDPAHYRVNGMSSKGNDSDAIPVCRFHHNEQHGMTVAQFEQRYGFVWLDEAKAQYAVYLIWKEGQA